MKTASAKKIDFLNGKIFKKLVLFTIPMAIATFLQMLFNAADIAIVGQFAGSQYQAAVGSTSSAIHLIVNLFIGVSIGANVAMANAFGAKDEDKQKRIVHTSMATSLIGGILVMIVGLLLCRPILTAMKTPSEIIDYAVLYMQIYFLGAPAMLVYNFGASLMRGVGEAKKPLRYLFVSGILNVLINAVTVIFFDLHVIGVALGTTVSQYFAAAWIVFDLRKEKDGLRYSVRKTRFHKKEFIKILKIGVPMGFSSCLFSFSNLFVQSAVNGFGDVAIAGNTVAANIDTMVDAFTSSIEKSVVTVVGQNYGANKRERIHKVIGAGLFATLCVEIVVLFLLGLFGKYVCMIYNSDAAVIEWALKRVHLIGISYGLVMLMTCYGGALRGMGYSFLPMLVNLIFTCLVRILYLSFIFPTFETQTIQMVYILYPITWLLSGGMQTLLYYIIAKKQGHFKKPDRS